MAATTILDFVKNVKMFSDVSFSLYVKFCANACNSDRVVAIKQKFKMALAAILDFFKSKI